jgi:hypothetical protein
MSGLTLMNPTIIGFIILHCEIVSRALHFLPKTNRITASVV